VARHAAGEQVFAASIPDQVTFTLLRGPIYASAQRWRESWNPAGVAFLLDLSVWGLSRNWPDAFLLLRTAEELVTGRPVSPGPSFGEFERLFHRVAVAGLVNARELTQAEDYFTRLDSRLAALAPDVPPAQRLSDPHLALTRGMLDEAWTGPGVFTDARRGRDHLQRALVSYERAAQFAVVADEARVRRAFVLHRLGRQQEALAVLSSGSDQAGDPTVRYWRLLVRGRVLEALDRGPEALDAYREARVLSGGAQTPAVALAALSLRLGHVEEARRWAHAARVESATTTDTWWQYWFDMRWIAGWVSELRRQPS
jgi:tetratricopeptide (TPR) repeat protein